MTIRQLHHLTGKLTAKGYGRRIVCINKASFNHPLEEDGCCILEVESAEINVHDMLDENGGRAELANGLTKQRTALVLSGGIERVKGGK